MKSGESWKSERFQAKVYARQIETESWGRSIGPAGLEEHARGGVETLALERGEEDNRDSRSGGRWGKSKFGGPLGGRSRSAAGGAVSWASLGKAPSLRRRGGGVPFGRVWARVCPAVRELEVSEG